MANGGDHGEGDGLGIEFASCGSSSYPAAATQRGPHCDLCPALLRAPREPPADLLSHACLEHTVLPITQRGGGIRRRCFWVPS
jgi:hypothetical protein